MDADEGLREIAQIAEIAAAGARSAAWNDLTALRKGLRTASSALTQATDDRPAAQPEGAAGTAAGAVADARVSLLKAHCPVLEARLRELNTAPYTGVGGKSRIPSIGSSLMRQGLDAVAELRRRTVEELVHVHRDRRAEGTKTADLG